MSRPRKCRNVCHFPQTIAFVPAEEGSAQPVVMTVDEYETIRLIDKEGYAQEQCAQQMGVARTTVQQVYAVARRKLAEAIVDAFIETEAEGGRHAERVKMIMDIEAKG